MPFLLYRSSLPWRPRNTSCARIRAYLDLDCVAPDLYQRRYLFNATPWYLLVTFGRGGSPCCSFFQERKGMEGSLFIVRRSSHPHFKVRKHTHFYRLETLLCSCFPWSFARRRYVLDWTRRPCSFASTRIFLRLSGVPCYCRVAAGRSSEHVAVAVVCTRLWHVFSDRTSHPLVQTHRGAATHHRGLKKRQQSCGARGEARRRSCLVLVAPPTPRCCLVFSAIGDYRHLKEAAHPGQKKTRRSCFLQASMTAAIALPPPAPPRAPCPSRSSHPPASCLPIRRPPPHTSHPPSRRRRTR